MRKQFHQLKQENDKLKKQSIYGVCKEMAVGCWSFYHVDTWSHAKNVLKLWKDAGCGRMHAVEEWRVWKDAGC